MTAWQHPTDPCPACGQDILLRPEVTPDIRILYVPYCPRCDAGEPIVTGREDGSDPLIADLDRLWGPSSVEPSPSWIDDLQSFWTSAGVRVGTRPTYQHQAASAEPPASSGRSRGRRQTGVELWWDADGEVRNDDPTTDRLDASPGAARTRMDERWAAFAANDVQDNNDDDDDEMPAVAEGSFAFGREDIGGHRRHRGLLARRLRQSA